FHLGLASSFRPYDRPGRTVTPAARTRRATVCGETLRIAPTWRVERPDAYRASMASAPGDAEGLAVEDDLSILTFSLFDVAKGCCGTPQRRACPPANAAG